MGYPPPLAVSPSGETVAAGLPGGGIRLHDARSLRRLSDLPGLGKGPVTVVEFSPDGRTVAVTGEGGTAEVRDASSGRRVRAPLPGMGSPAQAMAFSPDGGRLAVADLEGRLRVMDLRSGKVRSGSRFPASALHLSFSPDGKLLAIGLGDRGTELRESRTLRTVARLRRGSGADGDRWVRFSPDGRLLAASSYGGDTQLWDVASHRRAGAPLAGHEGFVLNAEFSPDGRILATSGTDGTVILWDVASRRTLGTLPGLHGWVAARFTPDGRRLFVLHDLGGAQRWEVTPAMWSRHACRVAGRELTRTEWEELAPDQDYRSVCSR